MYQQTVFQALDANIQSTYSDEFDIGIVVYFTNMKTAFVLANKVRLKIYAMKSLNYIEKISEINSLFT